jgi:hypothetical protein
MTRRFRAELLATGGGGARVEVPLDVPALFGSARPPVLVTVNGQTVRTRIAVYGGRYYIGLTKAVRAAAGVAPGDTIELDVELDEAPREVELPPELAEALADPDLRLFYDGLSFTHRREYAEWIAEAKREDTRRRRAERAVELLREHVKTPR